MDYKLINNEPNEPKEIIVPETHETFEAQVVVRTKPYKKMTWPGLSIDAHLYNPLKETWRVLQSGKYRVELIPSAIANGKPTLLISETGDD